MLHTDGLMRNLDFHNFVQNQYEHTYMVVHYLIQFCKSSFLFQKKTFLLILIETHIYCPTNLDFRLIPYIQIHQLKLENEMLIMKNRKLTYALIIASLAMITITIYSISKTKNSIKNGKKDNPTGIA